MTDPRIQFEIDNLQESLEVEVKNWLNGLRSNSDKATLAKEIIALANHGGGRIYIGFDDSDMSELVPGADDLEAFTQDRVSELVNRYLSPPCQCRVELATRDDSIHEHPIVFVPGGHRTPVFAARGGPENEIVNGKVYVRRPGGYSEEARNQDDWERLIERLVSARKGDMIDQIREILEPRERVIEAVPALDDWHSEGLQNWERIVSEFAVDDPRRCASGRWMASFRIDPFEVESLSELNRALEREMPNISGWPPFTYVQRDPLRPRAHGDQIVAYLGYLGEDESLSDRWRPDWDYWQVSRNGAGFMLRPMQEDNPGYRSRVTPRGDGPFFDWVLPIYRSVEILKFVEKLGSLFGTAESSFELMLEYQGVDGRYLEQDSLRYNLSSRGTCRQDTVMSSISAPLSEIGTNLQEILVSLLSPIYEQFDFTALPPALVNNVVQEALRDE